MVMKASHAFNLLDARHAISVTERQRFILRVRTLAREVAQTYYNARQKLGFPLAPEALRKEELPPKALLKLSTAFSQSIAASFKQLNLAFDSIEPFASPRRLAVLVHKLAPATPVRDEVIWGPPKKIAFDENGEPSKAAIAFAKKNGIDVADLVSENDGKIDKLVFRTQAGGEKTVDHLEAIINSALKSLPIPKRMRWGVNRHEFVRPVHWLVMLYGQDIVDASVLGLTAGRTTRGHRFHYNQTLDIQSPADYANLLKNTAYVLADFNERKALIKEQVEAEAKQHGGTAVIDADLLNEVISSMKEHQKYFHMVDANGELLPFFITVANIESKDKAQVIDGNERVIRPRLSDAVFFFETDKKTTLASKRELKKPNALQN